MQQFFAEQVESGDDIVRLISESHKSVDSIAVDELFMIPGSGNALIEIFKSGISVYTSSLQLSSIPKSYSEVDMILPWATEVHVCPAVCVTCGADA